MGIRKWGSIVGLCAAIIFVTSAGTVAEARFTLRELTQVSPLDIKIRNVAAIHTENAFTNVCAQVERRRFLERVVKLPFCKTYTPKPPDEAPLEASCVGLPENAIVGETVTWEATASGGIEVYDYLWSGTDAFSGNESAVDITYTESGTKHAEVIVTSGDVEMVASCSIEVEDVVVEEPPQDDEEEILISEVYYDVDPLHGVETGSASNEWVEIHNTGSEDWDISGWGIADAVAEDVFPEGSVVPAGGFLIVTATSSTASFWDVGGALIVVLGSAIGNGLANGGDVVQLRDDTAAIVDAVSWGTNTTAFDPSVSSVPEGHSISRIQSDVDTDTAADWEDLALPEPGVF